MKICPECKDVIMYCKCAEEYFEDMNIKKIEVIAGIIYNNKKILCVQRGRNKYTYISEKYEFPGGKIEKNETHEIALKRELIEELNISVEVDDLFMKVKHEYNDFHLIMHAYICNAKSKNIQLNEHINAKWLFPNEMDKLDWAAADIPIVKNLQNF